MSAFAPIFLRQKSSNLKCKHKKASSGTFVQKCRAKMLVKLTQGQLEQRMFLGFIQMVITPRAALKIKLALYEAKTDKK